MKTVHELMQILVNRGLTQKQIAKWSGINQPTVSRVICGVQNDISYAAGKRLEAFELRTRVIKDMAD